MHEDITAHSMLDQALGAMQEVNAYHACDADLIRVRQLLVKILIIR